ncbi:MAG: MFS transporter [Leptospiraceae bacterium]|nr:MFS transporter [Leptospiraceae bacterium]
MTVSRIALYAFAESGIFAVEFFVRLQLLIFYTDRLGVESYLASVAAGIALTWDAFIDPFVGAFSDRFRSRWGNRKPFLVVGALVIAPSLLWLFSPYTAGGATLLFAQLLFASLLLNTGITLVTVPHAAISAELTSDAQLRVRVFATRLLFANIGLIIGLLMPALSENQSIVAAAIGVFCLFAVFTCAATLKIASAPATHKPSGLIADFRAALSNRFFVWLFVAGFLAYIGVAINSTLARYYYDHFLKLNEKQFALVLIVFIIIWSLSVVLWVKLADKYGKDKPATFGIIALGLMTMLCYPLFPQNSVAGPVAAAIAGGIFTGCILLFDSYVADAADDDFARSGERREGLYFGVWKFGIKASRGVAVMLSGVLLWAIGYRAGAKPDDAVAFRIALLFGPLVGSIFVLSGIVFYRFAAPRRGGA